eukprot:1087_1
MLFLWVLLISKTNGQTKYCDTKLECVNDTFNGFSVLHGRGYQSLFQSPTSYISTRYCSGALSCKETPNITGQFLECIGIDSCSNCASISTNINYVYAGNALRYSNISCLDADYYIYANRALTHSIITADCPTNCLINGAGTLSLFGTRINVLSGTLNVDLRGYYAGYTASIYCYNGAICNINCYDTGCSGLSLICYDNNCNINPYGESPLYPNTNTNIIIEQQDEIWKKLFNLTTITT